MRLCNRVDGVRHVLVRILPMLALFLWAGNSDGLEPSTAPGAMGGDVVRVLQVQGPIGPATRDYLVRAIESAAGAGVGAIVIRMDTPGGLDASTRDIIQGILGAPVPVITWVAPEGARAASAGAYILVASHVAAMSPATNVGAATPVSIIGSSPGSPGKSGNQKKEQQDGQQEEEAGGDNTDPSSAMERKTVNDATAYIRGLAEKRGRNADWAERAVRSADSITSEKALELGVIDLIAGSLDDLLEQTDGMVVEVNGQEWQLATRGAAIERLEPDWRSELLAVITSPTIAYLLLLIGVYGLILEGYHPGAIVPGVVGAICLLLALYAFQMLPVNYAGLGLIVLGIILMIGEVMAPSFGALGIGGIIAMVIGSVILIDTEAPGFAVSRSLIGSIALAGSLGLMAVVWLAMRARQRPVVSGREQMLGAEGFALGDFSREGEVFVHSERWHAITETPLRNEQPIVVTGVEGLTLHVRPVAESQQENENV